ncbi:MAG TPA: YtxH domain-containing protein [Vicinamibacterales bacterium]|nr:YtxH domain-containing protein [Vicinamibacterales bacterium]
MHEVDTYYGDAAAHSSGFVMGLLCGAALGAALGLLFAPKTGSELRGQLYDSTERLRRRAGEVANDAYQQASGTVEDLVDKGRSAIRRGRQKAEDTLASVAEQTTSG